MMIRSTFFLVLIALICTSGIADDRIEYTITKQDMDQFRKSPRTSGKMREVIETNDAFIHKIGNEFIQEAVLEHRLIRQFSRGSSTTYIIFEYFQLEGVTCNLKAITLDENDKVLSIIQLAEYTEYPDGELLESTIEENDIATRTTVVRGMKAYNDSLDQIIMKIDSTIVTFRLNQFTQIERVDSVFKHFEYVYE